jgi:hypothetical protein
MSAIYNRPHISYSKINNPLLDTCTFCNCLYNLKWMNDSHCYFCSEFLPVRDTFSSIITEIDTHYLLSGYTSRKRYYNEFLDGLNKWCDRFRIMHTDDDKKKEVELRNVKDWTREYWH